MRVAGDAAGDNAALTSKVSVFWFAVERATSMRLIHLSMEDNCGCVPWQREWLTDRQLVVT